MSRRTYATILCIVCIISVGAAHATLTDLIKEFDAWWLEQDPQRAARYGDQSRAGELTDNSYEARQRRYEAMKVFRERLEAVDVDSVDGKDRINHEVMAHLLSEQIGEFEHGRHYLAIGHYHGIHFVAGSYCRYATFTSAAECESLLNRLESLPAHVEAVIELLKKGIERGMIQPRDVVKPVTEQIDAVLENDVNELVDRFSWFLQFVDEEKQQLLWARLHQRTLVTVRESLMRLRTFLVEEYIPKARESIAMSDLPVGADFYAHELAINTTTVLTPRQLHEMGMAEVERLRPLMIEVIRRTDFLEIKPDKADLDDGELFAAFRRYVHQEPRFRFESAEELITAWRDLCKRIDLWMPSLFRTIPRLPFGVEPKPAAAAHRAPAANYMTGNLERGYASLVSVNTSNLDGTFRFEVPALVMHEAIPGHHMEQALATEMVDVPVFRMDHWLPVFGEGWALYAESLGIEMGLYIDPYDDFGRLQGEMLRACRLAIDPAIHALGWSRDRAEDLLREHTILTDDRIKDEIDRYIAWPGQATAYKIGELKIRELRSRAEEQLGAKFDIREFHDVVLLAGAVPLPVLERRVDEWIERER